LSASPETGARHVYREYGIAAHREIPLPLPVHDHPELPKIELLAAPP
jgi:hypothetical protein